MISILDIGYFDCIQVNNLDECNKLLLILHKAGFRWNSNNSYLTYIDCFKMERPMYFRPKKGGSGSINTAKILCLKIYQLSDIKEYIGYKKDNLKDLLEC
jgi:hypothetical protein